jgi:hypothetical protein
MTWYTDENHNLYERMIRQITHHETAYTDAMYENLMIRKVIKGSKVYRCLRGCWHYEYDALDHKEMEPRSCNPNTRLDGLDGVGDKIESIFIELEDQIPSGRDEEAAFVKEQILAQIGSEIVSTRPFVLQEMAQVLATLKTLKAEGDDPFYDAMQALTLPVPAVPKIEDKSESEDKT